MTLIQNCKRDYIFKVVVLKWIRKEYRFFEHLFVLMAKLTLLLFLFPSRWILCSKLVWELMAKTGLYHWKENQFLHSLGYHHLGHGLFQLSVQRHPACTQDSVKSKQVQYILQSLYLYENMITILPYFGKRKQVTKVKFLVKDQNVSVISTDVNGISCLCLTFL